MPPYVKTENLVVDDENDNNMLQAHCPVQHARISFKTLELSSSPLPFQKHEKEHAHQRSKARVSFDPILQVKEIHHINDLKEMTNVNDVWYSDAEYTAMRSECQRLVSRWNRGRVIDEHEQSLRGLEDLTALGESQLKRNVFQATQAVLHEQWIQRVEGVNDPGCLADLYFLSSLHAQVESQTRGLRDHQAVIEMAKQESQARTIISQLAFM